MLSVQFHTPFRFEKLLEGLFPLKVDHESDVSSTGYSERNLNVTPPATKRQTRSPCLHSILLYAKKVDPLVPPTQCYRYHVGKCKAVCRNNGRFNVRQQEYVYPYQQIEKGSVLQWRPVRQYSPARNYITLGAYQESCVSGRPNLGTSNCYL